MFDSKGWDWPGAEIVCQFFECSCRFLKNRVGPNRTDLIVTLPLYLLLLADDKFLESPGHTMFWSMIKLVFRPIFIKFWMPFSLVIFKVLKHVESPPAGDIFPLVGSGWTQQLSPVRKDLSLPVLTFENYLDMLIRWHTQNINVSWVLGMSIF